MDEINVSTLIAKGETSHIEFKREIDLSVARSKAEFVKDIVALANSTTDVSYLLVGVDNSKLIVGIKDLPDEQIQQIIATYITPPVNVVCQIVPMSVAGLLSVGVLEVRPTDRPHRVSRPTEQLNQHDVFVRHGAVVAKASPDEIIAMRAQAQPGDDSRQYIRAAETHARLGNYENAIKAYSKAIEIAPTAELFFDRGLVYECCIEDANNEQGRKEWARVAYKDFKDAATLARSADLKIAACIARWRVYYDAEIPNENKNEIDDMWQVYEWLQANTSGCELGEVLYIEIRMTDFNVTLLDQIDAAAKLDKIIQLGYNEPEVFALRATAHLLDSNHGLALNDINRAIESAIDAKQKAYFRALRAEIIATAGLEHQYRDAASHLNYHARFEDAYQELLIAKQSGRIRGYKGFASHLIEEILYRLVLEYIANGNSFDNYNDYFYRTLVRQVASWLGHIETNHPTIAYTVRQIVGEDFWQQNYSRLH